MVERPVVGAQCHMVYAVEAVMHITYTPYTPSPRISICSAARGWYWEVSHNTESRICIKGDLCYYRGQLLCYHYINTSKFVRSANPSPFRGRSRRFG